MKLARRLVTVNAPGGAARGRRPPFDDSWTRSGSNPILSPVAPWEQTSVNEPMVLYEHGVFRMWHSGGWSVPAIGYATSPDGTSWTEYAGNPVLGLGASGITGPAVRPTVVHVGSTYYMYYADANPSSNLKVATSTDGTGWTLQGTAIAHDAVAWADGYTNTVVLVDAGGTWHMIATVYTPSGPCQWQAAYVTSSDGLSWSVQGSGPLASLLVHPNGALGAGRTILQIGSTYHLWYHAAPSSGVLPTNIYHATSTDLVSWTQTSPNPILTYLGTGDEVDQVADPQIIVVGRTAYLFYSAVDNSHSRGRILLATAPATF